MVRYVAIEAANAWSALLRTYYLASATGAWLENGNRVTGPNTSGSVAEVLTRAVHHQRPSLTTKSGPWKPWQEPNWVDPNTVNTLLHVEQLSNAQGFLAAMGPAKGSNERLQTFRNFVAHRGRKSALKVRDLARQAGLLVSGDPLELLFHRAPKRPVSVFTEWIIELRSVVELLPR